METDHITGKKIMELVAQGWDPVDAFREATKAKVPTVTATAVVEEKPKKKVLNTMPSGKVRLQEWLEDHADVLYEYQFHPTRKWRFDWFLPEHNVAVEYEGFLAMGANAAHSAVGNIMRDVEKYNEAQAMGIRVFRAHAENTRTGTFFQLMERVLKGDK